ncbi:hypothetical protein JMJ77_0004861 [Colletotrichum scovillei]|uniref:Uncharacterized protein n=1 Tax=Colletotrichum scovillei TaxID=1209932 RepID=A0A9P7UK51_9PEZI|nr:hypothetical protein JMJ77_0004861 [Colletotrichum scovillei]KAG7076036.1 hypothetical protein JMJ76_0013308 [Colletotrichum scovillei]KAG7083235.1 hypothetical protein JMJ78_0008683 [Colletotrichum scovillei]
MLVTLLLRHPMGPSRYLVSIRAPSCKDSSCGVQGLVLWIELAT